MKTKEKLCIITLNEQGKIDDINDIENCTLNDFARDYLFAKKSNNIEIDETRNGNVYFKYIDNKNDKIYMVELYGVRTTKMNELVEDIDEIKTELLYRNED